MNEMTDNSLDTLIRETLERRQLLADLDRHIITDIQRRERQNKIHRWARALLFSFGVPMVLFVFVTCMYFLIIQYGASPFTFFIIAWPTLAIIFITQRALKTFSFKKE